MKNLYYIIFILVFFVACKPTSDIVTSKRDAVKKGVYHTPSTERVAAKNETLKRALTPIKEVKKSRLNEANDDDYAVAPENTSYLVKQLINAASDNLGAHYRAGGTTPAGYDCSGLMYATFRKFDITLPRSSFDMAKVGQKLFNDEIRKGDLIFFKTNGKSVINHVGMVVEVKNDEIKFIHSSTQSGVIISSTKEAYYGRTFAQANRILL